MAGFSYVQTDFRGGIWDSSSQGRMDLKEWKTALNVSINGWPTENGSWSRRPGFRYVCYTRRGQKALMRGFRFSRDQAYQAEFTAGKLRFIVGLGLLMDEASKLDVINIDNPVGGYGYGNNYGNFYGGETAAAVVSVSSLPADWADGDTIIFNIATQSPPDMPSTYKCFGRQFEIFNVNLANNTFQLRDPITQLPVTGIEIDYHPRHNVDTVQRVKEFNTPYSQADIENKRVRITQAIDNVLVHCEQRPTYCLKQSGTQQFTFAKADFLDGPYFDVNDTVTTLTPNGTTGNIKITASGTVGINEGDGFKATDVGRLIRFQCGPPIWDNSTVFQTNDKAIGSDDNIYRAVKTNSAQDPTTDDGTFWEITSDTVFWTWLQITDWTSSTVVHADVRGDDLSIKSNASGIFCHVQNSKVPTTYWRLGVYTDTPDPATGKKRYPTCGTYHDGRLCMAGAEPNRIDCTKSLSETFEFDPTYPDGTVADDSGLSFVLNSRDAQYITWLLTNDSGMPVGTAAGEWLVKASNLDDPLTPFDVQARLLTNYGCYNSEPVVAYNAPIFIQARGRKVLANRKHYYGQPEAMNLSINADGIMAPGLDELAWMQEPALSIFARRTDGKLLACAYKYSMLEEAYFGWSEHTHGLGRIFEGLTYGPNFQGTGDCIYAVTAYHSGNNDDDPVTNPRWIETIMPVASSGSATWAAWHTDASSTGWFIRRMIMANGDSFDGLRVYGLEHLSYLQGVTLHPWIGELDVGNFAVVDGHLDIPFAPAVGVNPLFTLNFVQTLGDSGQDYGEGLWGMSLRWADQAITTNPTRPTNTVAVLDDDVSTPHGVIPTITTGGSYTLMLCLESPIEGTTDTEIGNSAYRYRQQGAAGGFDSSIRKFNATTGAFIKEADHDHIFGAGSPLVMAGGNVSSWVCTVRGVHLFGPTVISADHVTYATIRYDNLTMEGGGIAPACLLYPPAQIIPVRFNGIGTNLVPTEVDIDYAVIINQVGIVTANRISIANLYNVAHAGLAVPGDLTFDEVWDGGHVGSGPDRPLEAVLRGGRGIELFQYCDFFIWGFDADIISATRVNLYQFQTDTEEQWKYHKLVTFTPAAIDPTWTAFQYVSFAPDYENRYVIGLFSRHTGGGNEHYLVKFSRATGDIVFKTAIPDLPMAAHFGTQTYVQNGWFGYISGNATNIIYGVDLGTGVLQTIAGQVDGFSGYAGSPGTIIFDGLDSFIFFAQDVAPAITQHYLGPFATTHGTPWFDQWNRLWIGKTYTQDEKHREMDADLLFIPVNFGVSFTSMGQTLRPDFGQDAGAVAGPAFGKIRRNHWWSASFVDSFNVEVGVNFNKLLPVKFVDDDAALTVAPSRFTGIVTTSIDDNYSKTGALAWRITRQYPTQITAIGGYIATQDK